MMPLYKLLASSNRVYLSFTEARRFVHTLGIVNKQEWRQYCQSLDKPNNIPATPHSVFKSNEWVGYEDWFGTGKLDLVSKDYDFVVYQLLHKNTNTIYVGITMNVERRFACYKRGKVHGNPGLAAILDQYGWDSLVQSFPCKGISYHNALVFEKALIKSEIAHGRNVLNIVHNKQTDPVPQ